MRKAMITVCGKYGDRYWVSDLMLTCFGKLCEVLGRYDIAVEYADSMDNAQMREPIAGIETEARMAEDNQVDFLFVLYRDDIRRKKLFHVFRHLRRALPGHIHLVFVATFSHDGAFTEEERKILTQDCLCSLLSEKDWKL